MGGLTICDPSGEREENETFVYMHLMIHALPVEGSVKEITQSNDNGLHQTPCYPGISK